MSSYHSKTYHLKGIEILDEGLTLHNNPLKIGKWSIETSTDGDLCIKNENTIQAKIAYKSPPVPEISDNTRFFMVDPCNIDDSKGLIVSNTNRFYNFDFTQSPTTQQSLPTIKLSTKENDPSIIGVINKCEEYTREYVHGIFKSIYEQNDEINRVIVNMRGLGSVWVTDKGGVLYNGDYITSSNIPGYGIRQFQPNIQYNFTLGKITHDCNFDPELQILQKPVDFNKNGPIYQPLTNSNGDFITDYQYQLKYITNEGMESTKLAFEQDIQRIEKILEDDDSTNSANDDSEGMVQTDKILKHPSRRIFRACLVGYCS